MLAVIRADASQTIGSGHIMRCLTLAERLRLQGVETSFICRDFPGSLSEYITSKGFTVHRLPGNEKNVPESSTLGQAWLGATWETDVDQTLDVLERYEREIDWLIIDHYGIDHRWQSRLRAKARKIVVIDDLANRRHDCDILLDQNYYHNMTTRYRGLVPKECALFLGPRYLLLREEFHRTKKQMRIRTGEVSNILVFYGGADTTNETEKCLTMLSDYGRSKIEIHVVTGHSNPHRERIEAICSSRPNMHYYCQVSNIAELMNRADLAFGAGGSTTWERCFLGLPSIVTITAENQTETTQAVADLGAIWNLGWYEKVSIVAFHDVMQGFLLQPSKLIEMQRRALDIVGTRGAPGIEQMVEAILSGGV